MGELYSTKVSATGGRHGVIRSQDGQLDMKLAMPKELGGPGGATNPEQLFAGGIDLARVAQQERDLAAAGGDVTRFDTGRGATEFRLHLVAHRLQPRFGEVRRIRLEQQVAAAGKVEADLRAREWTVTDMRYGADVTLEVAFAPDRADDFAHTVAALTAGAVEPENHTPRWVETPC